VCEVRKPLFKILKSFIQNLRFLKNRALDSKNGLNDLMDIAWLDRPLGSSAEQHKILQKKTIFHWTVRLKVEHQAISIKV
jgi:hypothetical protein